MADEIVFMLQTSEKDAIMNKSEVYEWFSHFRNGHRLLESQARLGRLLTSGTKENIMKIYKLILEDRTNVELVDIICVSWSFCQRSLSEELRMKKVAAKFVPYLFTEGETQSRV
ncbi:uncharacterized protein LOC106874918 [Octopus bimaculoides]|uniref:uncharacterized protein LOC106874918 n=1 Tax=Octopus bimaculoides TaxID=37653 RepID=UPI00071CB1C0|nr:uncharacterized protein LOC106874918 [Octopus bimaculoides]|eukprot:XP_014778325.1 PREDICTED: uncharacterized protein LOC106874918 [Octopus bimaculoides]